MSRMSVNRAISNHPLLLLILSLRALAAVISDTTAKRIEAARKEMVT